MSSCCKRSEPEPPGDVVAACPASGGSGVRVELQTIKALLTTSALRRLEPAGHRFCPEASCDVVYFDEHGRTFSTADLRVDVWQKQREGQRVLCYCFGENESDIGTEIATTGRSGAAERVRAHIRAGRCACEIRNPRGACCLGDVTAAVKRLVTARTAG